MFICIILIQGGPTQGKPPPSSQQYGLTADTSNTYIKYETCNLEPGNLYTVQVDSQSIQHQIWTGEKIKTKSTDMCPCHKDERTAVELCSKQNFEKIGLFAVTL